ncbi:DOMON-like domain-containing protein [Waterburya agarophytonicola K14]|uniref:DOMON-like domain-containing protein n=1 Tax=Waterburya agarophytonicola KI4 TaxID=2874699 RepID=A0A964FFC3_9CYAN|nr:DOMON-like domain-containing protein [Waterburya agarophytonicola]MCC0175664.1 DOMON-like domain-containing protein [Waterburya agarophytonicola KI4]
MVSLVEKTKFNLIPFDPNYLDLVGVSGEIFRNNNYLNIQYLMSGDLLKVIIPGSKRSLRKYDLWEHTCFEFFLRLRNTTKYWEFNLSPSGDWNIFRFDNYRENIAEEMAFDSLFFNLALEKNTLQLDLIIDLNKLNIAKKDLDLAISTVVENRNKKLSYWALIHPATEADFHHQDSFIINI